MSRTAEVGVAEADDGCVVVLVAGAVFVNLLLVCAVDVVRDGVRIGAELHDTEGCARSGEGVSHTVSTNHRIHVIHRPFCWLRNK